MSPLLLWLFFILDRVIDVFGGIMIISIIYLALVIAVALIGGFCVQSYRTEFSSKLYWDFCAGVGKHTKRYNILAIIFLCIGICAVTFLPNTKEAVAIAVIPKVIDYAKNNKEMVKIPDNVIKMANTFMEKKIQDWSQSLGGSKDSSAVPIDSQIKAVTAKVEELKKIKESAEKAFK